MGQISLNVFLSFCVTGPWIFCPIGILLLHGFLKKICEMHYSNKSESGLKKFFIKKYAFSNLKHTEFHLYTIYIYNYCGIFHIFQSNFILDSLLFCLLRL